MDDYQNLVDDDPPLSELRHIFEHHFGIDLNTHLVNSEIIRRSEDPDAYDRLRVQFDHEFRTHPGSEQVRRRFYLCDRFAIYLQSCHSYEETWDIEPENYGLLTICPPDEIRRIQHPGNAADYLLALTANAIADNPRLRRIFLKRSEAQPETWRLSSHFESAAFGAYVAKLPPGAQEACNAIPARLAFLREPDGACIRSSFGDMIVVSESLKVYLFYMNLFLFTVLTDKIPGSDCMGALAVAVRTMILTEAPDFDLDPRGTPPGDVSAMCNAIVEDQLQFVIGHEYAHALLGHLGPAAPASGNDGTLLTGGTDDTRVYTPQQRQEFEADVAALTQPHLSPSELADMVNGATVFFLGLDMLNSITNVLPTPFRPAHTHPDPIDRIWNLRRNVLTPGRAVGKEVYSDEYTRSWIAHLARLKTYIATNWVPKNQARLAVYGSAYLPSYRGTPRVDRFDY